MSRSFERVNGIRTLFIVSCFPRFLMEKNRTFFTVYQTIKKYRKRTIKYVHVFWFVTHMGKEYVLRLCTLRSTYIVSFFPIKLI